jgi:protein TonB
MTYSRLLFGGALGFGMAFVLFFIMTTLINSGDMVIDDKATFKLPDITMPEQKIEANVNEKIAEKPQEAEPPPDIPQQDISIEADSSKVDMGGFRNSVDLTGSLVDTGLSGASVSDGEYLPIVKVAPIYPRRAQSKGTTGYCTVEYTVTTTGAVRDPVPVDCQPTGYFEQASVKAALKFKYKPRVVDGKAVEVPGVQNRFTYELEK